MSVADALFTKVQRRVLGILFGNSGRSYYAREIISPAASASGAVQRELARLEGAGLVTAIRIGRQKHYQANASAPVFAELRGLVLETSGLADVLRDALAPVASAAEVAFVYGPIARGKDQVGSDVDVMLVSENLTYADLFGVLEAASARLGRAVNPTIYSRAEIERRHAEGSAFLGRVRRAASRDIRCDGICRARAVRDRAIDRCAERRVGHREPLDLGYNAARRAR